MLATWVLVAVNVIVYVAMLVSDGATHMMGFSGHALIQFGADYSPLVLDGGQWWRLLCATMVHINLLHIAMNMYALVQVGRILEPRWGTARILVGYVVTGVLGSLASVGIYAANPVVAAGASGAISGLIGATAVVGQMIGGPSGIRVRNSMAVWALTVIGYGFVAHADNAAHIGGLLSGAALAFVVEKMGVKRQGGAVADVVAIGAFLALAAASFGLALTRTALRAF